MYTMGRDNRGGCCSHDSLLGSVSVPRRVDCLNMKLNSLALGKGSSTFGNQPFHEIDLASPAQYTRLLYLNDNEDLVNHAVKKGGFASCLYISLLADVPKAFSSLAWQRLS
jgi:hypothetical protein